MSSYSLDLVAHPHAGVPASPDGSKTRDRFLAIVQKLLKGDVLITSEECDFFHRYPHKAAVLSATTRAFATSGCSGLESQEDEGEWDAHPQGTQGVIRSTGQVFGWQPPMNSEEEMETIPLDDTDAQVVLREGTYEEALEKFHAYNNGRDPTRGELIELVATFNREIVAQPDLAGKSISQSVHGQPAAVEVRYTQEGLLEILDGSLAPLDIRFTQVLTAAQIEEMDRIYLELAENAPFNNIAPLLELVKHINHQKSLNPQLTTKEIADAYHFDMAGLFAKYRSGTCLSLSAKFCEELKDLDIHAQMMPVKTPPPNTLTTLPIPGLSEQMLWPRLNQEARGVDHTDVVCFFRDEEGLERVRRYGCNFGERRAEEISPYRPQYGRTALEQLLMEVNASDPEDFPHRVLDIGDIAKRLLRGRYKGLIFDRGMIVGIDFLRGNFYINSALAKELSSIPLNQESSVSISLTDLADPEAHGRYKIDGVFQDLNHRTALKVILEAVSNEIILPEDFADDMIALAEAAPTLFEEFFLEPLPLLRKHYPELLEIKNKMEELDRLNIQTIDYEALEFDYKEQVVYPLCHNAPDVAQGIADFSSRLDTLLK